MTRRMLMLLVATAMAVLLAGCGSNLREDQGSSKGSEQEEGSSQQDSVSVGPTDTASVGSCADKASTVGQQGEASGGDVSNGKIVFTRSNGHASEIYVVDEAGAHETKLTCTKKYEVDPIWSPDGQKIAYLTSPDGLLYVMNADGTNRIRLGSSAGDVMLGPGFPAWSPDGQKIAYFTSPPDGGKLRVINADGTTEARLITSFSGTSGPAWSPDGERIVFAQRAIPVTSTVSADSSTESASAPAERLTGIYLINVDGTGLRKLTSIAEEPMLLGEEGGAPVWSPDGEKIAFYDNGAIKVINTDGSGQKELTGGLYDPAQPAWSPDGERIAFVHNSADLYVINADGSGRRRLANAASNATTPTWLPDSERIAFFCPQSPRASTTDSVSPDLCVINADGTGLQRIATKVDPPEIQVTSWGRKHR